MKLSIVRGAVLGFACVGLAACSSGSDDFIGSGFLPASSGSNGTVNVAMANERNARIYDSAIGGTAYVTGTTPTAGALAYAGIMPNPNVGVPVSSGTVRYTTRFRGAEIEDIRVSGQLLTGQQDTFSGTLNLDANFDTGSVTGAGNSLVLNGTTDGRLVTGTATMNGRPGTMQAIIGQDAVVGGFHGTGTDSVFAGGFIGRSPITKAGLATGTE